MFETEGTFQLANMTLSVEKRPENPEIVVCKVSGDLANDSSYPFMEHMITLIRKTTIKLLVIDLEHVSYASSSGIGSLSMIYRELSLRNASMRLSSVAKKVTQVLNLLGFTQFFVFNDSVEHAIQEWENSQS